MREREWYGLANANDAFVWRQSNGGWKWSLVRVEGDRTETIIQFDVDVIVMTTDSPNRFLNLLRGTTSERVLQ